MLYLSQDLFPIAVFYCAARVYSAFTDFLVLRGRITMMIISKFSKQPRYDALGLLLYAP